MSKPWKIALIEVETSAECVLCVTPVELLTLLDPPWEVCRPCYAQVKEILLTEDGARILERLQPQET